ncbi:proline dehydrogenase [Nocardioides sp. GY 10113]|uniref:proline dehydrogenase family protein n=1 Tax=Nocardioides sp. GY 10113 TaxID=2569761 RepID=UPI0010A7D3C7|nr:proline dehydrogenase family protein [Nocardioides sp. GY 10113]TIC87655.1 proline dehydrogenase [Nocardioides sp. GY 10113]
MLSTVLNKASRSGRARRAVEAVPITRKVVARFVAGAEQAAALEVARDAAAGGLATSLDILGEGVSDIAGARRTRDQYLALLDALASAGAGPATEVSVKLSALGQALPDRGHQVALDLAAEICAAATAAGTMVTLDMEDHTTVDSTLAIANELRREHPRTGTVLQSNLRRTAGDIADLAADPVRVRLVKGAYREPASVAYQRKVEVDEAYRADVARLMASRCYPMVATHDPAMIEVARRRAREEGRGASDWELQMLYGVRGDLQTALVAEGHQVRVYVPFGEEWYPYFMRRLAERPANVAFFLKALARAS